jgi:hypothetical protein
MSFFMAKSKPAIVAPKYTETELEYRSKIIDEMQKAQQMRDQPWAEFDDMDYVTYWETNAKAANAYLPPKADEQEVRTTSGTTQEKKNTLLTSILNLNLEPDIEAFDKNDDEVDELGTIMEDLVRKSRKIEKYDEYKRIDIYNELLGQGTVFVEERYKEYRLPSKTITNFDVKSPDKMTWKKGVDKIYKECDASLVCGLNVYLGNIRETNLENQPFLVLRRILTRAEAKSIYGEWGRWKNVPKQFQAVNGDKDVDSVPFNDWTLENFQEGMVEELRYFNKWSNDFQIMLNGVMMFPVKEDGTYPLTEISGVCEYPVSQGVIEKISNFAYGKSIPAKTKVDQALFDEMLKAIVIKTRKSYNPPLANNTGETLSKRVQWAGQITDDLQGEKLTPIGDNGGVTSAEFNAIQFIKQIIDGKSVDPIMEGQSASGNQTAREIVELKQQSMMRMGLAILGVVNMEKRLCTLRLYNILRYWTEPIDKDITGKKQDIYRKVSVDATFDEGIDGTREIVFTEEIPDQTQIYAEEELTKEVTGKNVRKAYINPKILKSMDYHWYLDITPVPKEDNALKVAQFTETVQTAIGLFAPLGKVPNLDYLGQRFAVLNKEDPDRFWQQQQPQMPGQMPGQPGQQLGNQLTPNTQSEPSAQQLLQQ